MNTPNKKENETKREYRKERKRALARAHTPLTLVSLAASLVFRTTQGLMDMCGGTGMFVEYLVLLFGRRGSKSYLFRTHPVCF
jgi:hypothetical protein